MKITALLITHDGASWLPGVLRALERSTAAPDHFVAVDTGSVDQSVRLVAEATRAELIHLDARTSYAAAVRAGLAACPPAEPDEWVWLLHDDAAPAPDCLEVLSATAAEGGASVTAVGPKLREWPSLRRLLEVGVTISPTGRRITGLETGEYDQGQHDEITDVLAVNTAGMLVRRDVLEQLGFDDRLPVFGNDIDFGWRAARAGHRILVAPAAVMFHVEAAHRGRRAGALAARPRRSERAAAVYTLLVNGRGATLPLRAVRLLLGGLLRALGLLAVRAPGEARDEILGLVGVLVRPDRVLSARRARRGAVRGSSEVRPLLAPFWLPYRQGLDFVTDVGVAVAHSWREQARKRDSQRSLRSDLLRSPSLWAVLVGIALALLAGRSFLAGDLHGGALLRAPDGVGHWWSLWWQSWHWTGAGSNAPGPAYLLPLAFVATVLLGHPGWAIFLLFVLCVPLAMYGALRFLRRIVAGVWAPLWGAVGYALLPILGGAVGQGRLGTVAAAVILPWAATAALGLAAPDPDRRSRAAWRTALAVALLASFVPVAWLLCLLLVVLAPFLGAGRAGAGRLVVVVIVPLLLLAPWAVATIAAPGAWLVEAGRPGSFLGHPDSVDLLLARATGPGSAPLWLSVGVPLAGAAALLRRDTRVRVLRAWLAALAAAVLLLATAWSLVSLPGIPFSFRPWPGFLVLVVQACFIVAAVAAADGLLRVISTERFGWRQPAAGLAAVVAVGTVLAGVGWWVVAGTPGPLDDGPHRPVPTYMSELAAGRDTGGVLVLTGDRHVVQYRLLRDGATRIGDDGVLALTPPNGDLTAVVSQLLSADPGQAARDLAGFGVSYIYAPAPARPAVTAALDATSGLSGASAPQRDTRAWQVSAPPSLTAVRPVTQVRHWVLIGVQLLTLVVAVLLALPSRREAR